MARSSVPFSNPYHILYLHPTLLAAQSNVAHSLNYRCCAFSFSSSSRTRCEYTVHFLLSWHVDGNKIFDSLFGVTHPHRQLQRLLVKKVAMCVFITLLMYSPVHVITRHRANTPSRSFQEMVSRVVGLVLTHYNDTLLQELDQRLVNL